jgi:hypothetical protein
MYKNKKSAETSIKWDITAKIKNSKIMRFVLAGQQKGVD